MDLVVCVGEKCHLNGSELVLKGFMDIIAAEKLEGELRIKACFCIGECTQNDQVNVRLGDSIFQADPEDPHRSFAEHVRPALGSPTPTANMED